MSDLRGAARPDATNCCYTHLRHCSVPTSSVCGLQGESDGDEDATAAAADDADMEEEVVGKQVGSSNLFFWCLNALAILAVSVA
jgi:hypothetical protein